MGCIVLGTSQVPGEPRLSVCTCSNPTPAGLLAPDHCSAATWPLKAQAQRLPRLVYRRSIAWLSDSLRAPCAAWSASQCGLLQHHARLASSCWSGSTGRAFHPHGSAEKFQSCQLHLIPLSQAFLTQWAVTEAVCGCPCARRSFPEARSAGGPEFICVDTEARSEIRQTTSGAPTDAASRHADSP